MAGETPKEIVAGSHRDVAMDADRLSAVFNIAIIVTHSLLSFQSAEATRTPEKKYFTEIDSKKNGFQTQQLSSVVNMFNFFNDRYQAN